MGRLIRSIGWAPTSEKKETGMYLLAPPAGGFGGWPPRKDAAPPGKATG